MTTKTQKLPPTLLLLLFTSLIISTNTAVQGVDYDFTTNTGTVTATLADDLSQYRLDFSKEIPRGLSYFHVELKVTNDQPTPIIYFSSTDDTCTDSRQQMAKSPNKDTVELWLKTEEFYDGDLFILVECLTGAGKTSYTLTFTGTSQIDMDENFKYSYLVGSGNKVMTFYANANETDYDVVTFYAVGSKSVTVSVDGAGKSYKWNQGSAITMKKSEISVSGQYAITVTASEGDYVTVGLNNIKDAKTEGSLLNPNEDEVSGYLLKNTYEDQCLEIGYLNTIYKTQTLYVTGRFYNRIAEVYLRDNSFKELDGSSVLITDGYYTKAIKSTGKSQYVCVRFPDEKYDSLTNIPFTFSVVEPTLNEKFNYYPPLVFGQTYRKLLPKNSIQTFGSLAPPDGKRVTLNVKARSGFPKMYVDKCKDYPFCKYSDNDLKEKTAPKKLNRLFTYSFSELPNEKAISSDKTVIIVKCVDDDNAESGYCDFDVSFTLLSDEIELVESNTLGHMALKGDKGTYKIGLEGDTNIRTINIDIMVLSGDINFSVNAGTKTLDYYKYYLSNKMYFKITLQDTDEISEISLEYTAALNSYYTIKWDANRRGDGSTQYRDYLTSGSSYLVDIDPTSTTKTKTIKLQNLRYRDNNPFLANFFALNCQFNLTREKQEISFFDGYAQEIITKDDSTYKSDYYDYSLTVTEADSSNYNHKMCMLYVAGMETSTSVVESEIIVAENINQQIIFEPEKGFSTVRFLYPNPDLTKDLTVKLNVIDIEIYKLAIYVENTLMRSYTLSNTQVIYLSSSDFDVDFLCSEGNVCAITVELTLDRVLVKTNPMAEIIIRPILNTPTYLQKGQAKKDFVCGERLYYLYTDIGKNEEGEISVDFMRGKGRIYAKVVSKNPKQAEEEANWRDVYRMPSADWDDSLPYDSYLKKLKVSTEATADCIEGCYLLVSILLDVQGDYIEDYRFFPFSILTRVTPSNKAYTDSPKVVIQVNEYIIGNVDIAENERIYEFYEVWLPHDSQTVEFDFQSEVAGLYINLGGTRPTTKNADFKLLQSGSHSILSLKSEEILSKANEKKINVPYPGQIQDINLVIGVWTDKTDSVDTELYSLRVHQPLDNQIDIVEVSSSQKILCKPLKLSDNQYRCLFMIVYDEGQEIDNIIAYGASNDKSATSYMYARYIDRTYYDQFKTEQLTTNLPTNDNAQYNSKTDGVDYIYTGRDPMSKYLYVSVVTDKEADIMFISSLGTYAYQVSPNPSSAQILRVNKGENIALIFDVTQDIIASIICIGGEAKINWVSGGEEDDAVYSLKGSGDRLTITSGTNVAERNIAYLVVEEASSIQSKFTTMDDPGFVFYVFFHLRDSKINFDEVYRGRALQVAYKNTDLPIYLYNKVNNSESDINVALKFIDNSKNDEGGLFYYDAPFKFNAALTKESIVYLAKVNPELKPSLEKSKVGVYDHAINTAQVTLSKSDLSSYNIKTSDNPTLFIALDKYIPYLSTYETFDVEVSVSKVNDGISPLDGRYHYGKLILDNDNKNNYKLKVNKKKKLMRIQVSLSSDSLNFAINVNENSVTNMTFSEEKRVNGKSVITLNVPSNEYLYLTFFVKDQNLAKDRRLNNYCFKYTFGDTTNDFKEYKMKNDKSDVQFSEKNKKDNVTDITATFNKIEVGEGVNVMYFLRVVPNETHVYKESYDTIAVKESPYAIASVRNPVSNSDSIELTLTEVSANWAYLEVIASINDGDNWEYECYKGRYNLRPYTPTNGGDSSEGVDTAVFLGVGVVLVLIVIGLLVAVIVFKNRNKSLLNQVKHVSFQKNNTNVDPNLLLKKQQNQGAPAEDVPPEVQESA